jgi:hypothetical protein
LRFRKERFFQYPVDKVTELFLDGAGYDLQELDNVKGWKVLKEEDNGDVRVGTKEWCAHGQIPKALQHIISPKMLTWLEHSKWDRKNRVYSFDIEPYYLRKQISCRGKTTYFDAGNGRSGRTFEIELKVDIPILGGMFESFVSGYLKTSEEQDYNISVKGLKKAYG